MRSTRVVCDGEIGERLRGMCRRPKDRLLIATWSLRSGQPAVQREQREPQRQGALRAVRPDTYGKETRPLTYD